MSVLLYKCSCTLTSVRHTPSLYPVSLGWSRLYRSRIHNKVVPVGWEAVRSMSCVQAFLFLIELNAIRTLIGTEVIDCGRCYERRDLSYVCIRIPSSVGGQNGYTVGVPRGTPFRGIRHLSFFQTHVACYCGLSLFQTASLFRPLRTSPYEASPRCIERHLSVST